MRKVLITKATYDDCCGAVDKAFEVFPIDIRGKNVLVKPNCLRAATPEKAITTHPAVVRAIVDKLEELGAGSITVGDNPGASSYGANEVSFTDTGLLEAAKGYYKNIGAEAVELPFNPRFADKAMVSKAVMDADIVISVPKFKTHGLTYVSAGVKNSFGILPGAQKANLHLQAGNPLRFNEMIVDVFGLRVPDLFIVDGILGMEGNGPASTDLRVINRILAADNAIALDATIARMMGFDLNNIAYLTFARDRGLGDFHEDSIEIIGELERIPDFKPPHPPQPSQQGSGGGFGSRLKVRPKAEEDKCDLCGNCVATCPAEALYMQDLPQVEAEKCIVCYCCQELCPQQAIQLV